MAVDKPAAGRNGKVFYTHPDTGESIVRFHIPYYKEAVDFVKNLALVRPDVGYVGWDIAITPDGPTLIEGNPFQGIRISPVQGAHETGWNRPSPTVRQGDIRLIRRVLLKRADYKNSNKNYHIFGRGVQRTYFLILPTRMARLVRKNRNGNKHVYGRGVLEDLYFEPPARRARLVRKNRNGNKHV